MVRLKTRRLSEYLRGYDGPNDPKSALSAMKRLFERLRKPKSTASAISGQTLYTHATCATDTRAVRRLTLDIVLLGSALASTRQSYQTDIGCRSSRYCPPFKTRSSARC